jgi:hypothetical protein
MISVSTYAVWLQQARCSNRPTIAITTVEAAAVGFALQES